MRAGAAEDDVSEACAMAAEHLCRRLEGGDSVRECEVILVVKEDQRLREDFFECIEDIGLVFDHSSAQTTHKDSGFVSRRFVN